MKEFQAVVMAAGRGSRMSEIVKGRFKCTLPIGNKTMLWYPLTFLHKNGFREAIVIVPESFREKDIEKIDGLKLDFVPIPSNEDWGTADSLRYIKNKLTSDFLVISCDLLTNAPLHALADVHRTNDASLTILLSSIPNSAPIVTPGHKGKHRHERDIIALDESSKRLILLNSEADIEDGLSIKTSILRKHPIINITTDLTDAHLYLMKKSLLDFICEHEHISTIKGELLPWLLKKQFKNPDKTGSNNLTSSTNKNKIATDTNYEHLLAELSSWNIKAEKCPTMSNEAIKCYAHIIHEGFCFRVNTLPSYAESNLIHAKLQAYFGRLSTKLSLNEGSSVIKSRIGEDNAIGENVDIAEKVNLRNTVVGHFCKIETKVKATNSVLMNNASIEEGAVVQGSLICSHAVIGKGCELKDCIVEKGQKVPDGTKLSSEVVEDTNELMEI